MEQAITRSTRSTSSSSSNYSTHTSTSSSEPADFIAEAKTLFRIAACGDDSDLPPGVDAKIVAHHCDELLRTYHQYRTKWLDVAIPFIAELRPRDLPAEVVYPFGGSDLVTALAVFPSADTLTLISLEPAGDVRAIDGTLSGAPPHARGHRALVTTAAALTTALALDRANLARLLSASFSATKNLGADTRALLPGEIVFDLAALAIHGYEPLSLRYFALEPDGSLRYLDTPAPNVELTFRRRDDPSAPMKTMRHIAQNLDDPHVAMAPEVLAHLEAKGAVATMTKAAHYLLWADDFSRIRDYLLGHMMWMGSDSTGIPPRFALPAGFVMETYGAFDAPHAYGRVDARDARDLRDLFRAHPQRPLPFSFGYSDLEGHACLIVTHKR